jgi:hypothetical protein
MKRILLTILALAYLALSVRATVHLHDCMDIFTGSITDIHPEEKEQEPCRNDPGQCKFETQRRVVEAPSKRPSLIDQVLVPVSACNSLDRVQDLDNATFISWLNRTVQIQALLTLHCVWRI